LHKTRFGTIKDLYVTSNSTFEMNISIVTTQEEHYKYAQNMRNNRVISTFRGTGIAKERLSISRKKWKPRCRYA
jgi:hypothetical protein